MDAWRGKGGSGETAGFPLRLQLRNGKPGGQSIPLSPRAASVSRSFPTIKAYRVAWSELFSFELQQQLRLVKQEK